MDRRERGSVASLRHRGLPRGAVSVLLAVGCLVLAAYGQVARGDTGGTRVLDIQTNTFTASTQEGTAVAIDDAGRLFVTWDSRRQQGGTYGVYGRLLDPWGRPLTAAITLNDYQLGHQWRPVVSGSGSGGVWVAWESFWQDGDLGGVVARYVDPVSDVVSPEIVVNDVAAGHQGSVTLAATTDGRCLVAWTGPDAGTSRRLLRYRILDLPGEPITGELVMDCVSDGDASLSTVAAVPGGGWRIAWATADAERKPAGIYAVQLDNTGKLLSGPVRVDLGRGAAVEPSLAVAGDGRFAVAWMEADGEDYAVVVRRFHSDGTPIATPTIVSDATHPGQSGASIAYAPDNRLVVAWNAARSAGGDTDVLTVWLEPDGRIGTPRVLTAREAGTQRIRPASGAPRVVVGAQGRVACAWSGDAGLGDETGANVTLMLPESLAEAPVGPPELLAFQPVLGDDVVGSSMVAGPHVPPDYDPKLRSQDPFGGDDDPFPAGGDFGFIGITHTGWTPPDPQLAAGPNHVVIITNGEIAFYTKDGTRTFRDEIENSFGFWGEVGATGFVFDPEALYDETTGRFFAMAAEGRANGRSYALVAVSDDSDPNGTWFKYRFDTSSLAGDLFDSPNIAVDSQAVYITGDGFGNGANYPVFIFDKASLLVGDPPVVTKSMTLSTSTQSAGIPPVSYGDPPALYMIEHRESSSNTQVRLIALTDPLGTPTFTTFMLTVPAYGRPEDPPQMGTSVRPETFDARFWSVAYRNGSLWATHHINSDRVLARWYEIAMNDWPVSDMDPQLVQSGNIDPGPGIRTFFSAIDVDADNNACMTFNRSASDEFISVGRALRLATDPPNTFQPMEIDKVSGGGSTSGRFGDYGGVEHDPNGGSFWIHHEYSPTGGSSWNTWVAEVEASGAGSVPCDAIRKFKSKCKASGKIVTKAVMFDNSQDGRTVTIAIDGNAREITVNGRRAKDKSCCFSGGHLISLVRPADCQPVVFVSCP